MTPLILPLHRDNSKVSLKGYEVSNSTTDSQSVTTTSVTGEKTSEKSSRKWWNFGKPSAKVVEDAVLGLSDGLTVPFALTAGLSVFGNPKLVVLGGLAELIAGMISMGLGGWMGAQSAVDEYETKSRSCDAFIRTSPIQLRKILQDYFLELGVPQETLETISNKLQLADSRKELKSFLMKNHYEVAEPPSSRAWISAVTLGAAYFLGGLCPLLPYVFFKSVNDGLFCSIGVMVAILIVFGYSKTCIVRGWRGWGNIKAGLYGAFQMLVVGSLAAGAAVGLVRLMNQHVDLG